MKPLQSFLIPILVSPGLQHIRQAVMAVAAGNIQLEHHQILLSLRVSELTPGILSPKLLILPDLYLKLFN